MQMLLAETLHPPPHSQSSRLAARLVCFPMDFQGGLESRTWKLSSSVAEVDFERWNIMLMLADMPWEILCLVVS